MYNTEIIEYSDKLVRDFAFRDLRQNGNELERQVVRFSSCEIVPDQFEQVWYEHGKKFQTRPVYRSTWSLAYPRS
jgi:hypothetical protein